MVAFETIELPALPGQFALPGKPGDKYVVPISGGADSSALAIFMKLLFPYIDFEYWFTDTGADEPEIYETLVKLEKFLGKPITRIDSGETLWTLIEKYNGYLPSASSRWCTRLLKLAPFEKHIQSLEGFSGEVWTFVGIRADEMTRVAFTSPLLHTELPFVDLGVTREDVFELLGKTVGIPGFYRTRTRSGCSTCPFQRKSEVIGLLQRQPVEFYRGKQYEKLSPEDQSRHPDNAVAVWKESGLALNHLGFPVPARVDARTKGDAQAVQWGKAKRTTDDLFGKAVGLWVGVELMIHADVGDHGVWMQRLVSYSRTRNGLERQLDNHYQHRLHTAEVDGLSADEMREELHYAVYYLQLPADLVDLDPPNGGYTWSQGESYAQIQHIVGWAKRTLYVAGLKQQIDDYDGANPLSWRFEAHHAAAKALAAITEPYGDVVVMDRYVAKEEVDIDDQLDEKYISCPMCAI